MRLTCQRSDIEHATWIARTASNPIMPIYGHLLLEAQDDRVRLTAATPESCVIAEIGAQVSRPGAIAVPSRLFSELVSALQLPQVEIWSSGRQLHVAQGGHQTCISCLDASEFPPLDSDSLVYLGEVDSVTFRESAAQVWFCTSASGPPVFSGILMERRPNEEKITMVATDSFRMAVRSFPASGTQEFSMVVPAKIIKEVGYACAVPAAFPVQLFAAKDMRRVVFHLRFPEGFALLRASFVSQLLSCSYPDYLQLIPRNYATRIVVDAGMFAHSCRIVQLFTPSPLQFTASVAEQQLRIYASSPEGTGESKIAARVEGEDAQFVLGSEFVMEMLRAVREPEVAIDFQDPVRPVCFRVPGRDDWISIIMPMVPS